MTDHSQDQRSVATNSTSTGPQPTDSSANCPCLLIAAPASGSGKTTITAALARWHSTQGRRVTILKVGPDFIDPMILQQACGAPVYSLDTGMMSEQHCQDLLYRAACSSDLILLEGMMGLFDGRYSAASLAKRFSIPVAFVIDVRAMADTFAAVSFGLANMDPDLTVHGSFANRVASPKHESMVKQGLETWLGNKIPWLGSMYFDTRIQFPERHLGLVQAREIQDLKSRLDSAAATIAKQPLSALPAATKFHKSAVSESANKQPLKGMTIAVAQDQAFSFVYAANLDFLEQQGAELLFTSPLNDKTLPACDALYLPGGYPELHARELSMNHTYIKSLQAFSGRILAECGGMIYLSRSLELPDNSRYNMSNLLPIDITLHERLQAIGWQGYNGNHGKLLGHSFHYSSAQLIETGIEQESAQTHNGETGEPIYRYRNITASYLHWYFFSNPEEATGLFLEPPDQDQVAAAGRVKDAV